MLYAHVTEGVVDAVGQPPLVLFDGSRWWDLRNRDAQVLATVGWYLVVPSVRPADTSSTKWLPVYTLTGSEVFQTWQEVPKTSEETAVDTQVANETLIRQRAATALTVNSDFLALQTPTNAQVLAQVRALTKEATGLIKLELRDLNSAEGTE